MKRSQGFTLVELMVALVIGLIIIAGAVQVFVVTKRTFNNLDGLAARQEALRFLSDVIMVDLRTAAVDHVGVNPETVDEDNNPVVDYSVCQGGEFAEGAPGRQVLHLGYSNADNAAGGREGEAYCSSSSVQEVRYFSNSSGEGGAGISMCYICSDGYQSSLLPIQSGVYFKEIAILSSDPHAVKFHLVFDVGNDFGFVEGDGEEERSFFFSAISRPFVISELGGL